MSQAQTVPLEIKVCIIGESDVGKTSLSMRYCQGHFPENSTPTIGASFLQHRISKNGVDLSLQIWDTAGQERFRSMAPMYYRGAKAAILVFDVTNETTFARSMAWLRDLKAHADPNIVVCLAGNKADKQISPNLDLKSCEDFAKSVHAKFVKTSALTGEGVEELFDGLVTSIIEVHKDSGARDDDTINLVGERPAGAPGSCC